MFGFEDEADFVNRGSGGKVVHLAQGQFHAFLFLFRSAFAPFVERNFPVAAEVDKVGMSSADDSGRHVVSACAGHFDVKFLFDVVFQCNVDAIGFGYHLFAFFYRFGCAVFQHFQLVFRFSDECAEGNGDRQPYHACARNAYAHGILQDVRTQVDVDVFGLAAQGFGCFCCTECYGYRFGTTNGWHHFSFHQSDDLLSFRLWDDAFHIFLLL